MKTTQTLKKILDEAKAKERIILPAKALLLAELAEGLELSAESVIFIDGKYSANEALQLTSAGEAK